MATPISRGKPSHRMGRCVVRAIEPRGASGSIGSYRDMAGWTVKDGPSWWGGSIAPAPISPCQVALVEPHCSLAHQHRPRHIFSMRLRTRSTGREIRGRVPFGHAESLGFCPCLLSALGYGLARGSEVNVLPRSVDDAGISHQSFCVQHQLKLQLPNAAAD